MNFSGKYTGVLWYGDRYPEYQIGEELRFQLEIEEKDNKFSGIANDIEGAGMSPDEAKVSGMISETAIGFKKIYRRSHHSDGKGGSTFYDSQEGRPILYRGAYNSETGFYEGTWEYMALRRYLFFFKRLVDYGSGTFRMKKMELFE